MDPRRPAAAVFVSVQNAAAQQCCACYVSRSEARELWPVNRRAFIALFAASAATRPPAARAQQSSRIRRVGVLLAGRANDAEIKVRTDLFERRLQQLGWVGGHNIDIQYRWTGGDTGVTEIHAKELASMGLDVILAATNTSMAALHRQHSNVPIVFVMVSDPVGMGYVNSFSHPGGKVTGFTPFDPTLGSKWLALLKEIAPKTEHVALMYNPEPGNNSDGFAGPINRAAASLGVRSILRPETRDDIEEIIKTLGPRKNGGLIFLPDALTASQRSKFVGLAREAHLPAVYPLRSFCEVGGLLSYGVEPSHLYWEAASYVDRILRGAAPGDLPVQAPTKFELVINLSAAKALGLEVPATLHAQADEVIE